MTNSYFDAVLREFKKMIDADIEERRKSIAAGHALSMDDYKQKCGVIQGIEKARDTLEAAIQNIEKR